MQRVHPVPRSAAPSRGCRCPANYRGGVRPARAALCRSPGRGAYHGRERRERYAGGSCDADGLAPSDREGPTRGPTLPQYHHHPINGPGPGAPGKLRKRHNLRLLSQKRDIKILFSIGPRPRSPGRYRSRDRGARVGNAKRFPCGGIWPGRVGPESVG